MEKVKINTEFIKLDQLIKWAGVTGSGVEAKELVISGQVRVNGQIENRRGKKIRPGDRIEVLDNEILVEAE
jgi:ribosome-associated protein